MRFFVKLRLTVCGRVIKREEKSRINNCNCGRKTIAIRSFSRVLEPALCWTSERVYHTAVLWSGPNRTKARFACNVTACLEMVRTFGWFLSGSHGKRRKEKGGNKYQCCLKIQSIWTCQNRCKITATCLCSNCWITARVNCPAPTEAHVYRTNEPIKPK